MFKRICYLEHSSTSDFRWNANFEEEHFILQYLSASIFLGLHYIHKKKILHRDLKTANVFLTKDHNSVNYLVKIGDLGVAKLLDTSTALASTIVGTP